MPELYLLDTSVIFALTDQEEGAEKDPELVALAAEVKLLSLPLKKGS